MFEDLNTFCTVIRHGSMSRAAVDLHLSQPAISQRLRSLEQEYGMPLLRRTNRGVEVTPAGEVLSRYAQRMISLHKSLVGEMDSLRTAEPKQVVIAATSSAGGYALPCTIFLFQQKNPSARIQLLIGNRASTLQRLNDGTVDMAVVEGSALAAGAEEPEGWHATDVTEEDLVLITPTTGPWSQVSEYTLEQLRKTPLILREPGSANRQIFDAAIRQAGLTLNDFSVSMEISNVDAVKTSVSAGLGVALISNWCVRAEARIGTLKMAGLNGIRFPSRWTLYYAKNNKRTMLHRSLVRTLRSPAERGFC